MLPPASNPTDNQASVAETDDMLCANCGTEILRADNYCRKCGIINLHTTSEDYLPTRKKLLLMALVGFLLLSGIIFGIRLWPSEPEVILRIHGSNLTGDALMVDLAKQFFLHERGRLAEPYFVPVGDRKVEVRGFLPDKPDTLRVIDIEYGDSNFAFKSLESKNSDIVFSWRRIKTDENSRIKSANVGDMMSGENEHPFAFDRIVIIVNQNNPLSSLSKEEVIKILTGQITEWEQLLKVKGRFTGKINLHLPVDNSEIFDNFKSHLLLGDKVTETATRHEQLSEISNEVNGDEKGLGLVNLSNMRETKNISITEEGALDSGQEGDHSTRVTDLKQAIYLYGTKKSPNKYVVKFLDFVLSEEGQQIVKRDKFMGLNNISGTVALGAASQCRELVKSAKRVEGFTCLFGTRSYALDMDAYKSIKEAGQSIAQLLKTNQKEILILGFADKEGDDEFNQTLSLNRARAVEAVFSQMNIKPKDVKGCGSIESGDTEAEKKRNRRVEVWFR